MNGWSNVARAFRNRNYRTYQLGRFFAQVTSWMYKTAVGWLAWKLTYSAAWLGVFGLLDQLPALVILPVAGALADRIDSLRVLRITQAVLLAQALIIGLLDVFDMLTLTVLIIVTLTNGVVTAAQQPASQSILPTFLRRDELATAYGLNSVGFNIARFIGPMIAGIVIAEWGTAPAILFNAVGAAVFSFALLRVTIEHPPKLAALSKSLNVLGDIRAALDYSLNHRGIGPTMIVLSALALLPFTIDLLLPSLADGVFHEGPRGLAWMTSAYGIGAMAQASVIARRGGIIGLSDYFVRAVLGLAFSCAAMALAPNIWVSLVVIFFIGFASSATRVSSMTLLQYSIDPNMRGRVASFYAFINQVGPAFASLFVGALGDLIGIQLTAGLMGVWALAVWMYARRRRDGMMTSLEKESSGPIGRR